MKRESVILRKMVGNKDEFLPLNLLWFTFIGIGAWMTSFRSGFNPFQSFLIALGFALAPLLIGTLELLVRNIFGAISDVLPSEENNLRKAELALRVAKLRLETEKTLIEARQIEQDRLKISDAAINNELLEVARVADTTHSEGRSGYPRSTSRL